MMSYKRVLQIFIVIILTNIGKLNAQELVIDEFYRIQLLFQMEQYESAIKFTKALNDSLQCEKNEILGMCYNNLGKYQESVDHYEFYIENCNPEPLQRINLGDGYYKLGMYEKAKEQFGVAYLTNPNNATLNFNLGLIEYYNGDKQDAASYFINSIKNTKEVLDFDYVNMTLKTLNELGEFENSLKIADYIISLWEYGTPEYKYSLLLKASIYGPMGQPKKAIQEINKVLELGIQNEGILFDAYSYRYGNFVELKDFKNACKDYYNLKSLDASVELKKEFECH